MVSPMITAADSAALLSDAREALRTGGVSQPGDRPGLPHLPEVETWLTDEQVILKVTLAPEKPPDADTIPSRVQGVLRSRGFTLAVAPGGATPTSPSPATALEFGQAVRIVSRC